MLLARARPLIRIAWRLGPYLFRLCQRMARASVLNLFRRLGSMVCALKTIAGSAQLAGGGVYASVLLRTNICTCTWQPPVAAPGAFPGTQRSEQRQQGRCSFLGILPSR